MRGGHSLPWLARMAWSWFRELMASLVKTLCRWYSTVRRLMNRRAAISELDRPSLASRAIWASRAVSSAAHRACVRVLFRRWPAARARLALRTLQLPWRRTSRARRGAVRGRRYDGAPAAATRRRKMGAGERHADTGAGEAVDGFAVQVLGVSPSLNSARDRDSIPSAQSVPPARALSDSRWRAPAACPGPRCGSPPRSARPAQVNDTSSSGCLPVCCAAASASW